MKILHSDKLRTFAQINFEHLFLTTNNIYMKLLWIDLNSSYAHSSLALPALHAQMTDENDIQWEVVSATINENIGMVVEEICRHTPDILAGTAWLFNHEQLMHIAARVKALLPKCCIALGGPEFLGDNEHYLRCHPFVS